MKTTNYGGASARIDHCINNHIFSHFSGFTNCCNIPIPPSPPTYPMPNGDLFSNSAPDQQGPGGPLSIFSPHPLPFEVLISLHLRILTHTRSLFLFPPCILPSRSLFQVASKLPIPFIVSLTSLLLLLRFTSYRPPPPALSSFDRVMSSTALTPTILIPASSPNVRIQSLPTMFSPVHFPLRFGIHLPAFSSILPSSALQCLPFLHISSHRIAYYILRCILRSTIGLFFFFCFFFFWLPCPFLDCILGGSAHASSLCTK